MLHGSQNCWALPAKIHSATTVICLRAACVILQGQRNPGQAGLIKNCQGNRPNFTMNEQGFFIV